VQVALELIDIGLTPSGQEDYIIRIAEAPEGQILGYICYGKAPLTDAIYDIYWPASSSGKYRCFLQTNTGNSNDGDIFVNGANGIGIGGGSASSMIQGENIAELDFNAVQRGDAEMEQKMNRVIRACVEMGDRNPIMSIHDQGAGGPCNVLTELVDPAGGRIGDQGLHQWPDTDFV
jgi:hypothetical protein